MRRLALNYHRCLTLPPQDCAGLCICENDILFRDGFLREMLAAVNGIETALSGDKYFLDAYIPYSFRRKPDLQTTVGPAVKYAAQRFYGTQCVYYSRQVIPEIAQRIYDLGVVGQRAPIDMLVREYAVTAGFFFGTARSLVQHIGFHSSSPGAFFHQAPSFGEDVPVLDPFPVGPPDKVLWPHSYPTSHPAP